MQVGQKVGFAGGSQPTLNRTVHIYEKTAQLNVGHFGHMLTVTTVLSEADGYLKLCYLKNRHHSQSSAPKMQFLESPLEAGSISKPSYRPQY